MQGVRFILLNFGKKQVTGSFPSNTRVFHIVEHLTGPDDIVDKDGHLARAYDACEHSLVLIRPDGYIAMISDVGDVQSVSNYPNVIG